MMIAWRWGCTRGPEDQEQIRLCFNRLIRGIGTTNDPTDSRPLEDGGPFGRGVGVEFLGRYWDRWE